MYDRIPQVQNFHVINLGRQISLLGNTNNVYMLIVDNQTQPTNHILIVDNQTQPTNHILIVDNQTLPTNDIYTKRIVA